MTNVKNVDQLMGENNVYEYREIAVTSKRQITIPKSFFDRLGIEDSVVAWVTDDGIFMKPIHQSDTVYDQDREHIIRGALSDGGSPDEVAKRINDRLRKYDEVIDRRLQEFHDDTTNSSDGEDDGFNGLDALFNTKDGTSDTKTRKEK